MATTLKFEAIGTSWTIDITDTIAEKELAELSHAIQDRIKQFDLAYSRFRSDSLVSKIAQHAGTYEMPEDFGPMIDLYADLYDKTGGKMTPLIGQTISDAGYDASYSLTPKLKIARAPAWNEVMSWNAPILTVLTPVLLDFGAIGKGYLVDIVRDIMETHGLSSFVIDAGGDIVSRAQTSMTVGLEDPEDTTKVIGTAHLPTQTSMCGSAGNRRAWSRYHHIIDPDSAVSPRHIKALWVIAANTKEADGLSTALFFTKPENLRDYTFEWAVMNADRSVSFSPGFPGEFF